MDEATNSSPTSPISTSEGRVGLYFCEICRKPFTNEPSRKRHIPYCRRTQGRQRARARSCQACSIAKTKCSSGTRCSRCVSRNLDCIYEEARSTRSRLELQKSPSRKISTPKSLVDGLATSDFETNFLDWAFPTDDAVFSTEINGPPISDLDITRTADIGERRRSREQVPEIAAGARAHEMYSIPKSPSVIQLDFLQDSFWNDRSSAVPSPMSMSRYQSTCVFKPHVLNTMIAQHSAGHILQAIRAYPRMMLRKATFPPFIHPHWYGSLPTPLANCMGIAHMFSARTVETEPFVWQTIRTEQQRLMDELPRFSAQNLLAAVQAYVIYIIMRISDNSQFSDLDAQMLCNFHTMCLRVTELCHGSFSELDQFDDNLKWEDWVLAESRRRIAVLWLLISRVVSVATNLTCDTTANFRALPLPSMRLPWEATSLEIWRAEYQISITARVTKMSFFGELIDSQRRASESSCSSKLNEWYSDIDNLGTLLTLAVNTF